MNESHIIGCIGSIMQFIVAGYAWRLNRRYGTSRVGWSLFGAFSLMALLQLVQCTSSIAISAGIAEKINVIYALISFMLLIGMVHLETMLKERLTREEAIKHMRDELEAEVKAKTAHLTRAIEELMKEMEETKRMSALVEETTLRYRATQSPNRIPVEVGPDTTFAPTINPPPAEREYEAEEEAMAGIMDGEWIAQF